MSTKISHRISHDTFKNPSINLNKAYFHFNRIFFHELIVKSSEEHTGKFVRIPPSISP